MDTNKRNLKKNIRYNYNRMNKIQKGGNGCYTFNESQKYICPQNPMDNGNNMSVGMTNIKAIEKTLNSAQSGGNVCLGKGTELGVNHACAPNDRPTVSELAWSNRYSTGISTYNFDAEGGAKKGYKQSASKFVENVAKKTTKKGLTSREAITQLVEYYTGPGFKYNGKGKSEYIKTLIDFNNAFHNAKHKTSSYELGGGEVKLFTLTKGKMIGNFQKKKATNKVENIGCSCIIKVDIHKKLVKNIKCTFEFLSKYDVKTLSSMHVFQSGGNGYYFKVGEQPIGGMAPVGNYLSCCPPVFDGPLTTGGGKSKIITKSRKIKNKSGGSQASDFCGDMSLREFDCKQPEWNVKCI